jgi:hypothetical protein
MAEAMLPTSRRVAGVGAGMLLALALAPASAALAQDGPEATILNLAAAIEAQQTDLLPTFFCPEQAAQASQFDVSTLVSGLTAMGLPEGVDASMIAAAITLDPEITSTEVVSQTDTEAVVSIVGSLSIGFDPAALAPYIEAMLTAQGLEVTPDMVEAMTSMMAGMFASEAIDISDEVTLVPGESMPWVICDVLGGGDMASPEPIGAPSPSPSLVPAG